MGDGLREKVGRRGGRHTAEDLRCWARECTLVGAIRCLDGGNMIEVTLRRHWFCAPGGFAWGRTRAWRAVPSHSGGSRCHGALTRQAAPHDVLPRGLPDPPSDPSDSHRCPPPTEEKIRQGGSGCLSWEVAKPGSQATVGWPQSP